MLALLHIEIENAKQISVVAPHLFELEARFAGERCETLRRVLIGIFRRDFLVGAEIKALAADMHTLFGLTYEINLDPAFGGIVNGVVPPLFEVEIGAELAVGAREQIQIELRGHAGAVVVGALQHLSILLQISADQKAAAPSHIVPYPPQKFLRRLWFKVANRGAGE